MTNPWVISKIVHLLTPDRDIDPHGPRCPVLRHAYWQLHHKVNAVLERQILPGFDDLQRDQLCAVFESMQATHKGLRDLSKNHGVKVVERERFLKRMIRRMVCSARNHCRGTLEGFESRIERTSGRMTASITRQNKDSQRIRLLELRERVQTNESNCAVNTAQRVEASGRPPGNAATSPRRAKTLEYPTAASGSDP
jgi:hypothetical protein